MAGLGLTGHTDYLLWISYICLFLETYDGNKINFLNFIFQLNNHVNFNKSIFFLLASFGIFATFMISALMNVVKNFSTGSGIRHFLLYLGILSPNFLLDRIFSEINAYERQREFEILFFHSTCEMVD